MGTHGQGKHRTKEEEIDAVYSFSECALRNTDLDTEALESLAEQIIATFPDPRQARGIQLLIKTTIRRELKALPKTKELERKIPLAEAAKILDCCPDFLREEVSDENIECCPRVQPKKGKKGGRGGAIKFLRAHLERYEGKRV